MKKIVSILEWAALAAVVGYVTYGVFTQTGPAGVLIDLQMRWFGRYWPKATGILLIFAILTAGFALITWAQAAHRKMTGAPPPEPAAQREPAPPTPEHPAALLRLGLVVFLGALAVGGGGYLFMHVMHERERGSEFEPVRLDGQAASSTEPRGKFIALEAVPQESMAYVVSHSKNGIAGLKDYYVPLTHPQWNGREAVKYVLVLSQRSQDPSEEDLSGPFHVAVERDGLPNFLLAEYEKAGVPVSSPHYAATPVPVEGGRVGSRERNDSVFLIVGAFVALIGLLMTLVGAIVWFVKTRPSRRAALS